MKISLSGISATGHHGVAPDERREGQLFVVDVEMRLPAPVADDIAATVDYSKVAQMVVDQIAGEPVQLIETLGRRIADALLDEWPLIRRVSVTVHKPNAPVKTPFTDISCTITQRANGAARPFVLSLGANLADAQATLRAAVELLHKVPGVSVREVSSVYRTAPVEVGEVQPDYYNLVVTGETTLSAFELLRQTAAIEHYFGRERPYEHAPRTLDIDLVDVGGEVINTQELTLPHPRAHARGFVLVPWAEIAPDAKLPQGRVSDLAQQTGDDTIARIGSFARSRSL